MSGVIVKKMFWEDLPKWGKAGMGNEGSVNWGECSDLYCNFEYGDIKGSIRIIDYDKKSEKLTIEYLDKEFYIDAQGFKNCKLGRILETKTKMFKIEIGHIFKDDKRDMLITDREYRHTVSNKGNNKFYKYTCSICGWTEGWMVESSLVNGTGCPCCTNKKTVTGINDLYTTDHWMVELGVDEEFAKTHTKGSNKKSPLKCPDCGSVFKKQLYQIYENKSISCFCGDSISYPEKIMTSVLSQLKLNFKMQLNKSDFKWCGKYKYDFLIDDDIIVETHGLQHYKDSSGVYKRTLKEEQENDKFKERLALVNEIKEYIVIDCRYSDLEYIKNNILNSKLAKLYDLSNIDWSKVEEYAMSNLSKKACDLWNNSDSEVDTKAIAIIIGVSRATIVIWLKKWADLGLCSYDPTAQVYKSSSRLGKAKGKPVEIFKDDVSLGVFESCAELSRQSMDLFNVKLLKTSISDVASGKQKSCKGYKFKYV